MAIHSSLLSRLFFRFGDAKWWTSSQSGGQCSILNDQQNLYFWGLSTSQVYNNSWFSDLVFTRFYKSNSHLPLVFLIIYIVVEFFFVPSEHHLYSGKTKESQRRKEKGSREDSSDGRWDPKAKKLPHGTHEMGHGLMGWWLPVRGPKKAIFYDPTWLRLNSFFPDGLILPNI